MEEINASIKHALSFLQVVQNSIFDYRLLLEQAHQKEYQAFVENWKKTNKQKKQEQNTEFTLDHKEDSKVETSQRINIAELDRADQLLEKARKIRLQVKVPEKGKESNAQLLGKKQNVGSCTKKLGSQKVQHVANTSSKLKSHPHSNETSKCKMSAPPHKQTKSAACHLKNAHTSFAKPQRPLKKQVAACKPNERKSTSVTSKNKSSCHSHPAVVSKETFLSLKSLHIDVPTVSSSHLSITDQKVNCKAVHTSSLKHQQVVPFQAALIQKQLPSHAEFHKMLDDSLKTQPLKLKLHKKWAWYTFLSLKNELHLSRIICCKNPEDFKKVLLLLGKIQEAMFWLDFFSLVGKEISPHMQKLDKIDKNTALINNYFQSIFIKDYRSTVPVIH